MLRIVARDEPARADDAAQVALDQRDAGALDGDVGAGAHGDADVRPRERRRVVDAVAGHGDDAAACLELGDHAAPCPRAGPRRGPRRCRAPGRRPRRSSRLSPVTMTTRSPSSCELGDRLGGAGLDRIGDAEQPGERAVDGDEHDGLPARRAAPRRAPPARPDRCRARRAAPRCRAATRRAVDRAGHALAGERAEVAGPAARRCPRAAAPATIAAASGCSLPRSRPAARPSSFASSIAPVDLDGSQARLALGQRAGLVDDERVDLLQQLERLGVRDEHAGGARRGPVPTMIDIGVARPSAHGQAMISTATALTSA